MKKILFALDERGFSPNAFDYICRLNEREKILVTGIYIPAFINALAWTEPDGDAASEGTDTPPQDQSIDKRNFEAFIAACDKAQIEHRVHDDVCYSIVEGVEKETRFADLFVIGFESYYKYSGEDYVHEELRDIVKTAECPVLLVPEKAAFPDNVVVAYDGSASSVYAMKMFGYVLPTLTSLKTMIAYADLSAERMPDEDFIKELGARHFPDLDFALLQFEPRKYFTAWLQDRPNSLLVTGALGRSDLSQLFRKSFISELLKTHSIPVFITHR